MHPFHSQFCNLHPSNIGIPTGLLLALFLGVSSLFSQSPPTAPVPPSGALCDIGTNPAATLLVPYFEVDSADTSGMDTLVGVVNTSANELVARVVVWNVDAYSIFGFNIFLTGYDVVTFSMRQILVYGHLPNNACASTTYRFTSHNVDCDGDGRYFDNAWTENDGLFSADGTAWDVACYTDVAAATLADWQCKLSIGSYDGYNTNYVGYLTIDNTITCAGGLQDVNTALYFKPNYLDTDGDGVKDHGVLENSNVLMGDIIYFDHTHSLADAMPAVHIEAIGEASSLSGHTWGMLPQEWQDWGISSFYFKYESSIGMSLPVDAREPLPIEWGFRYIGNSSFDGGTWVDVWRSHNPSFDHWYMSGGPCDWGGSMGSAYTVIYDLSVGNIGYPFASGISFDEEEHTVQVADGPPDLPWFVPINLAAQRIQVESNTWPLVDESGWLVVHFDTDGRTFGPGFGNSFDQSWINVRYFANIKYSVGLSATAMINGCKMEHSDKFNMFYPAPTH